MSAKMQFFKFLNDYITFFEEVEASAKNKLRVIISFNLSLLEGVIAADEATVMRASALEKQRIQLQLDAGYGVLSLREIIDNMNGENKNELLQIYTRLSQLLDSIRFYNSEAAGIMESNLHDIKTSQDIKHPQNTDNISQNIRIDNKI